jgi:hypothetical protein
MKTLAAACVLAGIVAAMPLCAGCQEERTLVSERTVVEGIDQPSDAGRSSDADAAQVRAKAPPKYREHWWQFWRKPMPESLRIRREEAIRQAARRRLGSDMRPGG